MTRNQYNLPASEITPEHIYLSRRKFMVGIGSAALGALALSACGSPPAAREQESPAPSAEDAMPPQASAETDELGDPLNKYEEITNYNNYFEFTTDKRKVARMAKDFPTEPWTVAVGGLVNNPRTFDVDDLRRLFGEEERIYRLRCVEAWSMVIPWVGFPLADLIKRFQPTSRAKYVEFTTLHDPEQMPGQRRRILDWPYVEGLRMDEALHPLTILAVGLYGKALPNQNGAPLRLVVPWKYGFKNIKSIVRIRFTERQPLTTWMKAGPREYGFYANVNPNVDHPRWSQARERRIGDFFKRETLMFNGYAEEVARLYAGMDLKRFF